MAVIPIVSLLVVMVCSLLVVRVATVALVLTGLSKELARFQARSAFTGAGFTTAESEKVVHHPVRRRIIMLLMLLGNAGIVTAISSLVLSFVSTNESGGFFSSIWFKLLLLAIGVTGLWMVATSHWVDRRLSRVIAWALRRWTQLEARDYAGLLHLASGYAVIELLVEPEDWMAGRPLAELKLSDEGVLVLGIERPDGEYVGAPRGLTTPRAGDTVLLYGPAEVLENLDDRRAGSSGNWDHVKAVDRQKQVEAREAEIEEEAREEDSMPERATKSIA